MAKRFMLVDPDQPSGSKQPKSLTSTNWDLCALCQKDTGDALQCPVKKLNQSVGSAYRSFANNMDEFNKIRCLPMDIDIDRLDDGSGIEATFERNLAAWHKTCLLKFSDLKLERAMKKQTVKDKIPISMFNRRGSGQAKSVEPTCFFCGELAGQLGLREASTFDINFRVRKCAHDLQDTKLLAKLAPGDMIAQEAKYHPKCLVNLYNQASRTATTINCDKPDDHLHGIVFAQLVAYIEEFRTEEDTAAVFELACLADMYAKRLIQLGAIIADNRIHSTRLKNRLLAAVPDLIAHRDGRGILLTFDQNIGGALRKACDRDSEALCLARAAQIVRQEMFNQKFSFNGSFQEGCQQESIPTTLLTLVEMIQEGPNIKTQTENGSSNRIAALSISQLLMFNSVKYARAANSTSTARHSRDRESPLPIYVALKIHGLARKRSLVDTFFSLGLCISYDRLLQITSDIAKGVCTRFELDNVVCPPKMRHGLFTTSAVDNVDHNPSSATSHDSFHGTSISIIQHLSHGSTGMARDELVINQDTSSTRVVPPLPSSFTSVPPASLRTKEFNAPVVCGPVKPPDNRLTVEASDEERVWLNKVMTATENDTFVSGDWISWSAYHADMQQTSCPPSALNGLLPLFLDNAHSVAMIKHSMDLVKAAVQHLNPGQIPVLAADQPLYAIAKQIQWTWSDTHGEDSFIIMFGGLHIEMAVLKLLGDWLEDSGWTSALTQADVASSGTADSFISASHVTKTRHAHQVTAASLHCLIHQAYTETSPTTLSFDDWCAQRAVQSVHFDYWLTVLSLEIMLLIYVRSIREGNFDLYLQSLAQITPWMFALDHTHYARWLSVHIRDMMILSSKHPDILAEFRSGKFVVHKTSNKFSAMAIDQCHEQNNCLVKTSGGAVGLTDNPAALRRWTVAGPEVARLVREFEEDQIISGSKVKQNLEGLHHDQQPAVQSAFLKDVKSLIAVIQEMGNPFLEDSADLLVLDTKDIMNSSVAETIRKVKTLGEEQFTKFVDERLSNCVKPVTDPLPKNKLPLFSRPSVKVLSKDKLQLQSVKSDCNLFSRLYVACQARDGDVDQFFCHENQGSPPSLSLGGKLRLGTKADLMPCIEAGTITTEQSPVVDAKFLDGAAVVQMLNPGTAKTFLEYAQQVFVPYVSSQLQNTNRIDIVWDQYQPASLKGTTRQKRGKGVRRRVVSSSAMPKNWKDFLRVDVDENKTELFSFLSHQVMLLQGEGRNIYATDGTNVICSSEQTDISELSPCSHEEADTRLFLHMADATKKGCKKLLVRTVDTDVVVLAIATLNKIQADELWVAFGTGGHFRFVAIHEIVTIIGPRKSATLPMFHAFTGCDTVSSFGGIGKNTAWSTWNSFPEVTEALAELMNISETISDKSMELLERFVVLMYSRTSDIIRVNDARKQLFAQKSRTLENIPPTQAALEQHIKRARYQCYCWNMCLSSNPQLPNPSDWGWIKSSTDWQPFWTTLPEASKSCYQLIHCSCKKTCRGRCKCMKAVLKCTSLCACSGNCQD